MKTALRVLLGLVILTLGLPAGGRAEPARVLFVASATIARNGEDLGRPKISTLLGTEAVVQVGAAKGGPSVGFTVKVDPVDNDAHSPGPYAGKIVAQIDGKSVAEQVKTFRADETPWFGLDSAGFHWQVSINRMSPPKPATP